MHKMDLKISFLLSTLCFISGFFLLPYQLNAMESLLPAQDYEKLLTAMTIPTGLLMFISSVQIGIMTFILSFIGLKLARKSHFKFVFLESFIMKEDSFKLDRKSLYLSIIFGLVSGFIIFGGDELYFRHHIPQLAENEPSFSLLAAVTGILYGGVFEEVLLRLFFVSLLVWGLNRFFVRKEKVIPSAIYWIAIFIAALVFAFGHLPATQLIFGELTNILIIRCLILNGIGGILFGYLYWKKGFEYGVFAHMFAHITIQLLLIPLFY